GAILSDDGLGVLRTIASDVIDRLIEAIGYLHRDNRVEKFLRPIGLARRSDARIGALGLGIPSHLAARLDEHLDERAKVRGRGPPVPKQRTRSDATAGSPPLR